MRNGIRRTWISVKISRVRRVWHWNSGLSRFLHRSKISIYAQLSRHRVQRCLPPSFLVTMPAEPARRYNVTLFAERILPNKRVTASAYDFLTRTSAWRRRTIRRSSKGDDWQKSLRSNEREEILKLILKKRRKNKQTGSSRKSPRKLREVSLQSNLLDVAMSRASGSDCVRARARMLHIMCIYSGL